jgi:hypothetical protein
VAQEAAAPKIIDHTHFRAPFSGVTSAPSTSRRRETPGLENVRWNMITTPLAASRFLRRAEAAKHIREKWGYPCSPRTLAKYAVVGGGPPFRKAGRYPLYHPDDLDRWVSDKLSGPVTSTSELAANSSPMAPRPPPRCHYPPDEHSQSSTNQ